MNSSEDSSDAGGFAQRLADGSPFAPIALLPLGRTETMEVVIFGHRRAAIELALVVVAVFPRPARITLAGSLHVGRHFKQSRRARKHDCEVQYRGGDLPLF